MLTQLTGIFDTHAHYDDRQFDEDRYSLLASFPEAGISGVINCGCDVKTSAVAIELSEKFDFIYAAVGIHPHEAGEAAEGDLKKISDMCGESKVVAIGEIGLDYHYDFSPRNIQIDMIEKQVIMAKEKDLPIIVHDREAHEDTWNILKKYKPKGVVHCFSGSVEMARDIINIGMYIGLGGAVTFKNAKKPVEVAKFVPLDRLLLETDAPYMTPVPFRGKRNDSTFIKNTAETIAGIRGIDPQELIDISTGNAKILFNI